MKESVTARRSKVRVPLQRIQEGYHAPEFAVSLESRLVAGQHNRSIRA